MSNMFYSTDFLMQCLSPRSLFPRVSSGGVQRPREADFGQGDESGINPPHPALCTATDTGTQGQKGEQETNPAKCC